MSKSTKWSCWLVNSGPFGDQRCNWGRLVERTSSPHHLHSPTSRHHSESRMPVPRAYQTSPFNEASWNVRACAVARRTCLAQKEGVSGAIFALTGFNIGIGRFGRLWRTHSYAMRRYLLSVFYRNPLSSAVWVPQLVMNIHEAKTCKQRQGPQWGTVMEGRPRFGERRKRHSLQNRTVLCQSLFL